MSYGKVIALDTVDKLLGSNS